MDISKLKQINDSITDKNLSDKRHKELLNSSVNVSDTILSATASLVKYLNGHISKVELTNQLSSIRTPDAFKVVDAVNSLHETLKTHENTDLTEITKVMSELLDETKKIPKEHAKQKDIKLFDYSDKLKSLETAIKSVEEVIKQQKLVAEAPVVNVDAPVINVEQQDLKPLQSSIKDVVNAVKNIVIPESQDNKSLENLTKKTHKLLKELIDKPISRGGGGGGGVVSYVNSQGIATPVELNSGKVPVIDTSLTDGTQKTKVFDSWGDEIGATMIDEMMVSEKNRVAGGVFNGETPDSNFYTTVLSANGTANISNSVLNLATTTDANSSALVYTNAIGRYIGGNMNQLRGIFRVGDTGKANNTRRIGVTATSTLVDSFYFQLDGTTFSIVAKTTGLADIKVDNGSFNGDTATYQMTTNFHTWEILFTNKTIQFYIDKHLIHTLVENETPICGTRHLRPFMQNFNTGVGSVTGLYCQVLTLLTWGNTKTQPKFHYHEGQTTGILLKTGIGSLHSIVLSGVSNASVVDIYDGLTISGTKIWSTGTMGPQTLPFTIPFNEGIQFTTGLYIVKSGANCNTQVIYE